MAAQFGPVVQGDKAIRIFHPHADDFLGSQDLCTEAFGLSGRAPGQVCPAQALGEARIILDARTGPRTTVRNPSDAP